MESKNELKRSDIKNRVCHYFDDTINGTKINFSNILLDQKLHQNISVYNISNKTPAGPKPLRIRFDTIDGYIISLDGKVRHLIFFDYGLFNKYLIRLNILEVKKLLLQLVLIIISERSQLIHIILYLLKNIDFS